jgi:stage II sporulation protein R
VAQEGYDYPVRASLEETWFPTKEYGDFSLPAGRYQALRVVIGEGAGQNWWCVVFPPLCLGSVSESTRDIALRAGMDEQQVALLTGESEGYVVKFKALELWEQLKAALT